MNNSFTIVKDEHNAINDLTDCKLAYAFGESIYIFHDGLTIAGDGLIVSNPFLLLSSFLIGLMYRKREVGAMCS